MTKVFKVVRYQLHSFWFGCGCLKVWGTNTRLTFETLEALHPIGTKAAGGIRCDFVDCDVCKHLLGQVQLSVGLIDWEYSIV